MTSLHDILERHRVMWGGTIGLRRTPRELIDGAAAAGYRHVSMSAQDLRALGDDGLDELRRYGDARSVAVAMIDGFYPWMPLAGSTLDGSVCTLDEVLQQAEVVGAQFIGALALPLGLSIEDMAEHFAVAHKRVADAGRTITLEFAPLGGVTDLAAAHAVISPSGYAAAGIVFDTWHFFRGTPDFDLLETMVDGQIVAVQLSDAAAEVRGSLWQDTVHHRRQPGDGSFVLQRVVEMLERLGALDWYGPEVICDELASIPAAEAGRCSAVRLDDFLVGVFEASG